MDFDFDQIAVPFRMQPGLQRLAPGATQLTPLDPASALSREKRRVLEAGQSRFCVPGFDRQPAMEAIEEKAWIPPDRSPGQAPPVRDDGHGDDRRSGDSHAGDIPLELRFEEDLAILDGESTTLPWLCICVPSHWAPEEKLGLAFAAVHAPVADNAALQAAGTQLVKLVTGGGCWERFVWTITPSSRYDQHPARQPREPWPEADDPESFAAKCWLRAERQTFFPVGRGTRQAVFTIRVMLQPLTQAVASRQQAQRLHDSLASMSDAVLAYKSLAPAREPLLRWLQGRPA